MQYYSTSYSGCNPVMQKADALEDRVSRISATVPGLGIRNTCMLDISMYDRPFRRTITTNRGRL